MTSIHVRNLCAATAMVLLAPLTGLAASGIHPEVGVLLVSEADGQGKMTVRNADSIPLLLVSAITDVPDDPTPSLVPVPPVSRVEPNGHQVVRFVLEKADSGLKVQHYKRVTFEGVPPSSKDKAANTVRMNIRYDLPVVISPKGLVQHESPWSLITWELEAGQLRAHNPSPYVVRIAKEIGVASYTNPVVFFPKNYLLPGEKVSMQLPEDVNLASVDAITINPISLYGVSLPGFRVDIKNK